MKRMVQKLFFLLSIFACSHGALATMRPMPSIQDRLDDIVPGLGRPLLPTAYLAAKRAALLTPTTCTGGDWVEAICKLNIYGDGRCLDAGTKGNHTVFCAPGACHPEVGAACAGAFSASQWFPVSVNGEAYRCACGCVAEETTFAATDGRSWTALELLETGKRGESLPRLLSAGMFDSETRDFDEISSVIAGRETIPAITLSMESGRKVTITASHPIVVRVKPDSTAFMMRGQAVKPGYFLVTSEGQTDRIVDMVHAPYEGRMVNFIMQSETGLAYPNGYAMGDLAWQHHLARLDAGVMTISDILESIKKDEQSKATPSE